MATILESPRRDTNPGARPPGRTIVIGDVHGCRAELEDLLARVAPTKTDRVVFVGDLVARGPDTRGVLALVRALGALCVRGNHEDRLIAYHRALETGQKPPLLGATHLALVEQLGDEDWELMESFPLYLDIEGTELRIVHAGVVPDVPIEMQLASTLLSVRYLGPKNEPIEKGGKVLWGTRYEGPPHIVFGHKADPVPQFHAHATGIDTAAVYGERLTAFVLDDGGEIPPPDERGDLLVSVPAHARYYVAR